MNSDTNESLDVEPVLHDVEPVQNTYEDSLEGLLQYHADLSLWFKEQSKSAKTQVKREYYQKKLVKNNNNLWKLLVRTPNAYNPLMELVQPHSPGKTPPPDAILQPYCQVVDENAEPVPYTITSTAGPKDSDAIVVYHEVLPPRGEA